MLLVKRQIGQLNNHLAVYRHLQRRSNAFAGDNQASCNGVNPSCSGDEPVESSYVGEVAPRGMLAEPVVVAAPATVQHANYYHPATMEASLDYGALPGSSRGLVPAAQRQAAQHGFHPDRHAVYHQAGYKGVPLPVEAIRRMQVAQLPVAAQAPVQHAYHYSATMQPIQNFVILPGSSRGAVHRSPAGRVPASHWQAAHYGFHPQFVVPNGWTAGHAHAPTAVGIFGATITCSYPPQAQGGFRLSSRQSFAAPQDGAQHQHLRPQQHCSTAVATWTRGTGTGCCTHQRRRMWRSDG
ncbi:hypothetical protein ABZP36_032578 [Zizania latifolia]